MERCCWARWGHLRAARHCHFAFSETSSLLWFQTLATSQRWVREKANGPWTCQCIWSLCFPSYFYHICRKQYIRNIKVKYVIHNCFILFPGVLLYGPPGCGKTLIAKATAKASGCRFINLQASTLTDKWYGESQKLTAAVFSMAVKIQPCIIFIDEIGNHWICSKNVQIFRDSRRFNITMPACLTCQVNSSTTRVISLSVITMDMQVFIIHGFYGKHGTFTFA